MCFAQTVSFVPHYGFASCCKTRFRIFWFKSVTQQRGEKQEGETRELRTGEPAFQWVARLMTRVGSEEYWHRR
jgi:hypothetical protein